MAHAYSHFEVTVRNLDKPTMLDNEVSHHVLNIGNHILIVLPVFIEALEDALGSEVIKNILTMQPGDFHATHADITQLKECVGFAPNFPLQEGVKKFVAWYHSRYNPANFKKRTG